VVGAELGGGQHVGEVGPAVSQRAGLVEDGGAAGVEPLQNRRVLDDDAAAGDTAPMIATGMAMSSGQGVATTSTARNRTGSPLAAQAATPMPTASGVY